MGLWRRVRSLFRRKGLKREKRGALPRKQRHLLLFSATPLLPGPEAAANHVIIYHFEALKASTPAAPVQSIGSQEFWAFVETFLKEQLSAHTRRAYEKDLIDFLTHLKETSAPMTVHTLVRYRALLEARTSPRTGRPLSRISINRHLATIKSFLNWLVLNGVLPNNPARAVKSFRTSLESPTRDVPDDYVRRMLELPDHHTVSGVMHRTILLVLFRLGLRRSELVGLRTSDLFSEQGYDVLRVRGKGDKERLLPLPKDVEAAIHQYLRAARKDPAVDQVLFTPVRNNSTNDFTKELNPNTVAYIVNRYAMLAGVPHRISPHSARATAVSNALDHLAPHRAVQHMAGWSSPLMVTRYDKRKADLKNSAVKYVSYGHNKGDGHPADTNPEIRSEHLGPPP